MTHTRNFLFFVSILVIHAATAPSSRAGVQPISFFKEAADANGFIAVAADSSGVYAVSTAGVRRYDSQGNELWARSFDSPGSAVQVASDSLGVYVLVPPEPPPGPPQGPPQGPPPPCMLQRYSAAGDKLWSRNLDSCYSLAADATGVYVHGLSPAGPLLVKYGPDNVELWTHVLSRDATPVAGRLAADSTGVYVVSSTAAAISLVNALYLRKVSAAGEDLWSRTINLIEFPAAVTADGTGLYMLANDLPSGGNILRKYDALGKELWNRQVAPTFNPNNARLAADGTGAYVAGEIDVVLQSGSLKTVTLPGQCQSGSGSDSYIRKYDSVSGDELWARQFGTSQAAWAKGVAAAAGAVFVVGEEGSAQVRDDFEHVDAFQPANPTRAGFIARFESNAAVFATTGPRIFPNCVVNAASYLGGGVAPREIVTIFGAGIGPSEPVPLDVNPDGKLATAIAGTRVLFNGIAAPLLYVSEKQSSAIVPAAVAGLSTVDVQVEYNGVRSESLIVPVLEARPGIFSLDGSGYGKAAVTNEDGTPNSAANPAGRGSVMTLYATGGAETAAGVDDGQLVSDVLPRTSLPVTVFFDLGTNEFSVPPKSAEILYAGGVPGAVAGLLQINFRVPANAVTTGDRVPFILIIGSHWSLYQVNVALR